MKKILWTIAKGALLMILPVISGHCQIGIGTATPDEKTMLEVKSTTRGFLPPRMTLVQRNAMGTVTAGMAVFCTDCDAGRGALSIYFSNSWHDFTYTSGFINSVPVVTNVSYTGILRTAEVLQTTYAYFDKDGDADASTCQWYRANNSGGANESVITGATQCTYIPVSADVNKYLRVEVTPRSSTGATPGTPASSTRSHILNNSVPVAGSVSQSGSITVGGVLTGSYTFSDSENDPEGTSVYAWYRANNNSGAGEIVIPGATARTYTTTVSDDNKYLRFSVTPVSTNGNSPGTEVKASTYTYINNPPTVSNISFSGSTIQNFGSVITASYTYNDLEGDPQGTSTYQWYRDNDSLAGGEAAITGETLLTHTLVSGDKDYYLKFSVTPKATSGNTPGNLTMSVSYRFANRYPIIGGINYSPQIEVNKHVVCYYTYSDAEWDAPGTHTFQWYRATSSSGTGEAAITGQTTNSYNVPWADTGYYIKLKIVPYALTGSSPGSITNNLYVFVDKPERTCSEPFTYGTVSAAGYTWLDRNLGARQIAENSDDYKSIGSMYQWGRGDDGHQCIMRTSLNNNIHFYDMTNPADVTTINTSTVQCTVNPCQHTKFVTGSANWTTATGSDSFWNGTTKGINDPCPSGYRVPSKDELEALRASFESQNYQGAMNSDVKMPVNGNVSSSTGTMSRQNGNYWSSTYNTATTAYYLLLDDVTATTANSSNRATGMGVRCIAQ